MDLSKLIPSKNYNEFVATFRRMPMADEGEKPWSYWGWLQFIHTVCEYHPELDLPRYQYLTQLLSGADPGPIPQLKVGRPNSDAYNNISDCLIHIAKTGKSYWESFRLFIDFLLYGYGIGDVVGEPPEPPKLSDEVQEALYRTFNLEPWLKHPYDYLGKFICENRGGGKGWNPLAFFPTPHPVCEMMVQFQMADTKGKDSRFMTVQDPCCGTGRMLMHASNISLYLYGVDLDPMMYKITKLNGALYAPWIVWPIPASDRMYPNILHGDTLRNKVYAPKVMLENNPEGHMF